MMRQPTLSYLACAIVTAGTLMINGCRGVYSLIPLKAYPGPELAEEKVAHLLTDLTNTTRIVSVDGQVLSHEGSIGLSPGTHEIAVEFLETIQFGGHSNRDYLASGLLLDLFYAIKDSRAIEIPGYGHARGPIKWQSKEPKILKIELRAGRYYRISPGVDRALALESFKNAFQRSKIRELRAFDVQWNPYPEDVTDKYLLKLGGEKIKQSITFDDLPEDAEVTIIKFGEGGRGIPAVRTGKTAWKWEGCDSKGERVSPGLYTACISGSYLDVLGISEALGLAVGRTPIANYVAPEIVIRHKQLEPRLISDCRYRIKVE